MLIMVIKKRFSFLIVFFDLKNIKVAQNNWENMGIFYNLFILIVFRFLYWESDHLYFLKKDIFAYLYPSVVSFSEKVNIRLLNQKIIFIDIVSFP